MRQIKSGLLIFPLVAFLLAGTAYGILLFSLRPAEVQKRLVAELEALTEGEIRFKNFELHRFPQPVVELGQTEFVAKSGPRVSFEMKQLKIRLNVWSLFFGKAEPVRVEGVGGNLEFPVPSFLPFKAGRVESFRFAVLGDIRPARPVRFEIEVDLGKISKSLRARGALVVPDFKKWDWQRLALDVQFQVQDLGLTALTGSFPENGLVALTSGHVDGRGSLHKTAGDPWLYLAGNPKFAQVVYEIRREANRLPSPVMNLDLDFELGWNAAAEEVILKKAALSTPIGAFELRGHLFLGTGELKEGRLTATDIALEGIPQYVLFFKDAIPFNFGFSGRSNLDLSAEGALDHLALHANWDLSSTLLSYAKFFSKSKEVPMNLVFDALLKDQKLLSGDFSLTLRDATVKGTLTNLDFVTGQGDLNLITNKFQLAGWESILLPFQPYQIKGEIKILANLTGDFLQKPDMIKNVVNLTLDHGSISKDGFELGNMNLALDWGPVSFEMNRMEGTCGRSQISGKAVVYNPFQEPNADIRGIAPEFAPAELFKTLQGLFSEWLPENISGALSELQNASHALLPEEDLFENVETHLLYQGKEKQWSVENLDFDVYGGHVRSKGRVEMDTQPVSYGWESEVEHLNLERFFASRGVPEKIMEGDFSARLKAEGEGWRRLEGPEKLKGNGNFLISGGSFHGFDLLAAVAKINGFSSLQKTVSGETAFEELQSKFSLRKNKIKTKKMVLIAPDFSALGNGDISFNGILNYRWDVFLSKPLAEPILSGEESPLPDFKQFGPIPILFAGPLERPELEPDPARLPHLQESLGKKNQDFFRDFLTEDFLASRPTSS